MSHLIQKTYRYKYSPFGKKTRRKKWIQNITRDLFTFVPPVDLIRKYTLPTSKCSLLKIISCDWKRNAFVEGCYLINRKQIEPKLSNKFHFGEFLSDGTMGYIQRFILKNITRYVTCYDSRIESFIETLFLKRWRLILHLLLTTSVVDQHGEHVDGDNHIHLDDDTCYVVERLLDYNIATEYNLSYLFHDLSDSLERSETTQQYLNDNLLNEILVEIHLEPYKILKVLKSDTLVSVRFHVPKNAFQNEQNNLKDTDHSALVLLAEKYKMSN